VTEPQITPDDTKALRAQGSWREFLDLEMARGNERRLAKPPPPPAQTGHRPGAWPPGTRPPDPPPPIPPDEVARATAEYRQWRADGSPPGQYRCECPNCQLLEGENR
jgi:hypothetical protein